jgi:hypothetical protein
MKKENIIAFGAFIVFALVLLAFVPPPASLTNPEPGSEDLLGVYEGVTPCADCPGIRTRLTLTKSSPDSAEGTYELSLTYLERDVEPYVTEGLWTTERGTMTDPDATVYALDPDMPDETQRYVRVDADTVRQLAGDGSAIPAELPFDLNLVVAGADQGMLPEVRTVTGTRICLSHKDTSGPQTMECAFGLAGDDGQNYALDLASVAEMEASLTGRVEVTGMFVPSALLSSDQWMRYDMTGIVSAESIEAI